MTSLTNKALERGKPWPGIILAVLDELAVLGVLGVLTVSAVLSVLTVLAELAVLAISVSLLLFPVTHRSVLVSLLDVKEKFALL